MAGGWPEQDHKKNDNIIVSVANLSVSFIILLIYSVNDGREIIYKKGALAPFSILVQ
jgi:hypothetical protein